MPSMSRKDMLTLAVLIGVGFSASYLFRSMSSFGENVAGSGVAQQVMQGRGSPEVSNGRADLTMIVFTDYQCAACRKADPEMRKAIEGDGNIRVVYKDWPIFGVRSERAAMVALAAARQGIYPRLHHALMASPRLNETALQEAVESCGGDWQGVLSDLRAHGTAIENQLALNATQAFGLGLEGTPGYLIGPIRVRGGKTKREFVRAFSEAREAAKRPG